MHFFVQIIKTNAHPFCRVKLKTILNKKLYDTMSISVFFLSIWKRLCLLKILNLSRIILKLNFMFDAVYDLRVSNFEISRSEFFALQTNLLCYFIISIELPSCGKALPTFRPFRASEALDILELCATEHFEPQTIQCWIYRPLKLIYTICP